MANKAVGFLTFNFGANMQGFDRAMKKASTRVAKFGRQMKRVGSNMTNSITLPILGVGAAAVKMATDFGTSMTKIRTLVGASAEELKAYEKDVLSLSATTGVAASQLAEGLFFITSAGLSGQEAIDALSVSAKASAMQMGDMNDIASALTSVMKAYEGEQMSAARAGDLLHETLKQGKFEASEFMSRLGRVIPTAAAAGISFEELGAAAATMSKLSGDAASTLTGLNQLMMKLLNPSAEQIEILSMLGMTYGDLSKMLDDSLMGTLQHLFNELEGTDDLLLKMFGSSKAVTAALSTMGLQSETYTQVLDGMNNSVGNVNEGFDILSSDAGFRFQKTLNQVKLVLIDIGNIVMPLVLKGLEAISRAISKFSNLSPEVKKMSVAFALILASVGPLLTLFGSFARIGALIARGFALVSIKVLAIIAAIGLLVASFLFLRENYDAIVERLSDWSWWRNALIKAVQTLVQYNPLSVFTKALNALITKLGGDPLPDPFESISEKLEDLKVETKEYENDFTDFGTSIKNQAKQIKNALNFDLSLGLEGGTGTRTGDEPKKQKTLTPTSPLQSFLAAQDPQPIKATTLALKEQASVLETLAEGFEISKKMLMEYGEKTKQILIQGAETYEEYGKLVKNTIRDIIGAMIAEAVASAVAKAMASIPAFPGSLFLIPAIAGLAGGLARTAFNSLIPKFAEGGIVSGPTLGLMGEYAGANANPEVVAPLNKLKTMMGEGTQQVEVFGRISGTDIFLANRRTAIDRSRGY